MHPASHDLEALLSGVAAGIAPSELGELFTAAEDPFVVSLAGGMPALGGLPWERLADLARDLLLRSGPSVLQYGGARGRGDLRAGVADVVAEQGLAVDPDDVLVTAGSQQALDLVARALLDPGDTVLVEAPTYVGALGVLAAQRARIEHVALDDDGLRPDALEEALRRAARAGRIPKLLYTVPHHQNPAGVTLALERRHAVLDLAGRYGVLVLEDDPYALLGFSGPPLPSLRSLAPDLVVHTGSLSKTLAPGFRLGWVLAPEWLRSRLELLAEATVLCPSGLTQAVAAEYLATTDWRNQVERYRDQYRERRDSVLGTLDVELPEATWTRPGGGFYVWLTLPDGLDATTLAPAALAAGVAYVPGSAFFADGGGRDQLRLAYCFPPPDRLVEGIRRLGTAVRAARR
ncbi:PLP-dependent aminotransferase family protein [Kineococcus gynurae]|uniref:PLP-dependent aminotransferase family protein n=1 Tax=Kineococcus gynurae TaxID=452979 RepID=A0ABV5LT19_9ACTN